MGRSHVVRRGRAHLAEKGGFSSPLKPGEENGDAQSLSGPMFDPLRWSATRRSTIRVP